jgi:two-component system, NarL family, sensor histidine kinase LiaS
MSKKHIPWPFRRLQGKLTFSYTLATLLTILSVEFLVVGTALLISSQFFPNFLLQSITQEAPQAPPYFVHGTPDHDMIAAWLQIVNAEIPTKQGPFRATHYIFLTVVDTHGQTIASIGTHPVPDHVQLQTQLSAQNQVNLNNLLYNPKYTTGTVAADAHNTLVAITPIHGSNKRLDGLLVIKVIAPGNTQLFGEFFSFVLVSMVMVTIFATFLGIISGYITARSLVRRLKEFSQAAGRWSRGNFSTNIHDDSEDELGQTAQQLNHMARELQNLLLTRQKLATLEERNRLARDLHDSVKQQVFAVSMQIGATKYLLRRDVDGAEVRLNEAEKLVRQAQQELTALIRELRPAALEGKGFVVALRELATQWAQQTTIVANVSVEGTQPLPLVVEEALFRIAQEALANVARHSKANLVQISLKTTDDAVTLSIIDNGQGFDTTAQEASGVGLHSMQERMKPLGGEVQIKSVFGKGTQIIVHCNRLLQYPEKDLTVPV